MVRFLPIHKRNDPARHEPVNEISFTEEDRYDFPPVEGEEREEKKEHAGVIRLVHGWTQKLQKEKVSLNCFCQFFNANIFLLGPFHLQRYQPQWQQHDGYCIVLRLDCKRRESYSNHVQGCVSQGIRRIPPSI